MSEQPQDEAPISSELASTNQNSHVQSSVPPSSGQGTGLDRPIESVSPTIMFGIVVVGLALALIASTLLFSKLAGVVLNNSSLNTSTPADPASIPLANVASAEERVADRILAADSSPTARDRDSSPGTHLPPKTSSEQKALIANAPPEPEARLPLKLQGLIRVNDTTVILKSTSARISKDGRRVNLQVWGVQPGEENTVANQRKNPTFEFVVDFLSTNRGCVAQDMAKYALQFTVPSPSTGKAKVLTLERAPTKAVQEILTLRCNAQKPGGIFELFTAGRQETLIDGKRLILAWNVSANPLLGVLPPEAQR